MGLCTSSKANKSPWSSEGKNIKSLRYTSENTRKFTQQKRKQNKKQKTEEIPAATQVDFYS